MIQRDLKIPTNTIRNVHCHQIQTGEREEGPFLVLVHLKMYLVGNTPGMILQNLLQMLQIYNLIKKSNTFHYSPVNLCKLNNYLGDFPHKVNFWQWIYKHPSWAESFSTNILWFWHS